jgi:hypothetical protein
MENEVLYLGSSSQSHTTEVETCGVKRIRCEEKERSDVLKKVQLISKSVTQQFKIAIYTDGSCIG